MAHLSVAAIVPAAGKGTRLKSKIPKPFIKVNGKPLLLHTLLKLKQVFDFKEIIVACEASQMKKVRQIVESARIQNIKIVAGGVTRAQSVQKALAAASSEWALVHDAARPLVSAALVKALLAAAQKTGGAISALPSAATVKEVELVSLTIQKTLDRQKIYFAQTPQVFRTQDLLARYKTLGPKAYQKTDEAALFDGLGARIKVVPGDAKNIKITTQEDVELFKFYLRDKK